MTDRPSLQVVSLRPSVKPEVVEMAERILRRAEAGEIVDLSWCAANPDGSVSTGFTSTEDSHRRLAAVSRLLHRLHVSADDVEDVR